jgi:hypothetical protein
VLLDRPDGRSLERAKRLVNGERVEAEKIITFADPEDMVSKRGMSMGRIARTIRVNGQNVPFDMKPSDLYDASGQLPAFCLLSGDRLDYHAGNSGMENLPKALHDALRRAERQGFVFPLHATIKFADGEETMALVPEKNKCVWIALRDPSQQVWPATVVVREWAATGEWGTRTVAERYDDVV